MRRSHRWPQQGTQKEVCVQPLPMGSPSSQIGWFLLQILPLVFSGPSRVSSPTRSPEEPTGLSSPARSPGAQVRVQPTASSAYGAVGSRSGWGSGPVWPTVSWSHSMLKQQDLWNHWFE